MTSPFLHKIYGLLVQCPFQLPGAPLAAVSSQAVDMTVVCEPEEAWDDISWQQTCAAPDPAKPAVVATPDGSVGLVWGREIRVLVSPDCSRLRLFFRPAKLEFVPTVFVGFILGFVLHLRGTTCLHGAVLAHQGSAFALLGDGGAGKSTLAAALVQHGARLWSDDLVVLAHAGDTVVVERGSQGLRLTHHSSKGLLQPGHGLETVPYLDKFLWDMSGQTLDASGVENSAPLPLRALYLLCGDEREQDVSISAPLPAADALRRLIAACYPPDMLSLLTPARLAELHRIASLTPVHLLSYQKTWDQLPRVVDVLLQ